MSFFTRISLVLLLSTLCQTGVAELPTPSESDASFEPLARRFWRPQSEVDDPPEVPLWPEGAPRVRDVTERVEDRGAGHRDRWVTGIKEPTITFYRAADDHKRDTAVVVCPGGGYSGLAYDKEGHDTARWLNSLGITAVVLKYRCTPYTQPVPGEDAQRAIAVVRASAAALGVHPERIGIMGYSAGGHVASTAGTHYRDVVIDGQSALSRPDFLILVYPVISMDADITHRGSRNNLLGREPSVELVEEYSNDLQVTRHTPPTFLVHAADDRAVPLEHSLRMMRALEDADVPVELALYEHGGHGFGLVSQPIPAAAWPHRCAAWLRQQGFLGSE